MKFKNIKKEASSKGGSAGKKQQSPSKSRTIPAFVKTSAGKPEPFKLSFPKFTSVTLYRIYRGSLKAFIVVIFLLAAFVVGIDLRKNLNIKKDIDMQRENLTRDLKFWEDFITEHKDYRDAYFQASILEYKLGKINQAKMYVEKGLSLDPNSEDGKKFEQFLLNK